MDSPDRSESSVISTSPGIYSYSSLASESTPWKTQSLPVSNTSSFDSWSSFPTSVPSASASSASASLLPYIMSGQEPSFTVIVESFTIPLPWTAGHPKHVSSSTAPLPTLSTVVATATVPLNSTFTTIVHTFTITESPLHSSPVPLFSTVSISEDTSCVSAVSDLPRSAASQESVLRSISSDLGSSNSGFGPDLPRAKVSTMLGAQKIPVSMTTATFTLTLPTSTSLPLVPFSPTHSGPMTTDQFTVTLPAPPKTTSDGTETVTICTSSTVDRTSEEPCTSPLTTTTAAPDTSATSASSHAETSSSTSSDKGLRTYTLTTKVTISLDHKPKTTPCANESVTNVPSGFDAITVTYTIPGGPGRASQTVTLTTIRPRPSITSGGSSSFLPSASSSGIWTVGNLTTVGPASTGIVSSRPMSTGFSWSASGNRTTFHSTASGTSTLPLTSHSVPSPGIIVITKTRTLTWVHTTMPNATLTMHGTQPQANMTTLVGTGATTTIVFGPRPSSRVPAKRNQGREADCERRIKSGRINLDVRSRPLSRFTTLDSPQVDMLTFIQFDNVTTETEQDGFAPISQRFANPDQGITFSSGFQLAVSSPSSLFVPSSLPAMLRFDQIGNRAARIGMEESCYRFNLVSWSLGCDSIDTPCRFNITGLRSSGSEDVVSGSKVIVIPQASKASGNKLQPTVFGTEEFSNLSSFTVLLEVDGSRSASWWSDDLSVAPVCNGASLCTDLWTRDAAKNDCRHSGE